MTNLDTSSLSEPTKSLISRVRSPSDEQRHQPFDLGGGRLSFSRNGIWYPYGECSVTYPGDISFCEHGLHSTLMIRNVRGWQWPSDDARTRWYLHRLDRLHLYDPTIQCHCRAPQLMYLQLAPEKFSEIAIGMYTIMSRTFTPAEASQPSNALVLTCSSIWLFIRRG